MSQDKDLAISKNLVEHYTRFQDLLDKINELWLAVDNQRRSFEEFKNYMEKMSKESNEQVR